MRKCGEKTKQTIVVLEISVNTNSNHNKAFNNRKKDNKKQRM